MRAIFLDRDGVINKYPGDAKYVTSWEEFKFLPKAKEAIAAFTKHGFKIFLISNQAGVNKGVFSQGSLDLITERMLKEIDKAKGKITKVCYCIHRPEENCSCRKPKAGTINKLKEKYHFLREETFFVGDSIRDVLTAKEAGCKSILVLSGKEKLSNQNKWETQPDFIFENLFDASKFILKNK